MAANGDPGASMPDDTEDLSGNPVEDLSTTAVVGAGEPKQPPKGDPDRTGGLRSAPVEVGSRYMDPANPRSLAARPAVERGLY